jgi:hypothetical protein
MVWGFTDRAFGRTKQVRPGRAPSPEGPRTEAGTPTRDRPAKGPVETGLTWSDDLHRCTPGSPAYVPAAAPRCGAPPARCGSQDSGCPVARSSEYVLLTWRMSGAGVREGRSCSIPCAMRGTFTPPYRLKVPFMRRAGAAGALGGQRTEVRQSARGRQVVRSRGQAVRSRWSGGRPAVVRRSGRGGRSVSSRWSCRDGRAVGSRRVSRRLAVVRRLARARARWGCESAAPAGSVRAT